MRPNELKNIIIKNISDSNLLIEKINYLINQPVVTLHMQNIVDAEVNKIIVHLNIDAISDSR